MSKQKLPTISPQKPPAQLPAATSRGQLPAVAKATHPVRALKDFAASADDLAEHYGKLQTAYRNILSVRLNPNIANAQKHLDEADALLSWHDQNFRGRAKELELALNERFNPDDAYDDDCRLLEARVRAAIALLLASFPNANPGNSEAYVGLMVEEVMAEDNVSLVALETACSQIRRTSKFPPTTAEVIEAIQEQTELWEPRLDAIHFCGDAVGRLRNELKAATERVVAAKAEREEERRADEERQRAREELRAKPLVVGDRVAFDDRHSGVIVEAGRVEGEFECEWADVVFDDAWRQTFPKSKLTRQLPGDSNYEPNYWTTSQNRKKLPVVGDRVFVKTLGPGTVVPDKDWIMIRLDDGQWDNISAEQWKVGAAAGLICRLLHGERYFVAGQEVWDRRDG